MKKENSKFEQFNASKIKKDQQKKVKGGGLSWTTGGV